MQNQATYYTNISTKNYHPFGMPMPGRHKPAQSGDNYRFGFNGMEKDDEWKGNGNSLDFGARIYDSRLGRFFSVDPHYRKYPYWGGYNFTGANNPIVFIDFNGFGPKSKMSKKEFIDNFVKLYRQNEKTIVKVVETVGSLANGYAGVQEVKGGVTLAVAGSETGVGIIGGVYMTFDGIYRAGSTPFAIYGIWTEDNGVMGHLPENLGGVLFSPLDNVSQTDEDYFYQNKGDVVGNLGTTSRRRLIKSFKKWSKDVNNVKKIGEVVYRLYKVGQDIKELVEKPKEKLKDQKTPNVDVDIGEIEVKFIPPDKNDLNQSDDSSNKD